MRAGLREPRVDVQGMKKEKEKKLTRSGKDESERETGEDGQVSIFSFMPLFLR